MHRAENDNALLETAKESMLMAVCYAIATGFAIGLALAITYMWRTM